MHLLTQAISSNIMNVVHGIMNNIVLVLALLHLWWYYV